MKIKDGDERIEIKLKTRQVVIAEVFSHGDKIGAGAAIPNPVDTYDQALGETIAIGRALKEAYQSYRLVEEPEVLKRRAVAKLKNKRQKETLAWARSVYDRVRIAAKILKPRFFDPANNPDQLIRDRHTGWLTGLKLGAANYPTIQYKGNGEPLVEKPIL